MSRVPGPAKPRSRAKRKNADRKQPGLPQSPGEDHEREPSWARAFFCSAGRPPRHTDPAMPLTATAAMIAIAQGSRKGLADAAGDELGGMGDARCGGPSRADPGRRADAG